MKNILFTFVGAWLVLSGCSNKELSREKALSLLRQETQYPKIIHHDIFCGDPKHAIRVLDAGLETQGLLTVQRTQKLSDIGKPLIQFTDIALPYLLETPEEDKISKIQRVKLAEEELKEVTGIKMLNDGKSAIATYTVSYKNITPFAVLVKRDFKKEASYQASFSLYDDGWRIEKKPGIEFLK